MKLYKAVVEPVETVIADRDMIVIAPDGGLNLISFAGLIDNRDKYFIERYRLHYVSAGRDLLRFKYRDTSSQGLLALGDPDFDASVADRMNDAGTVQLASVFDAELVNRRLRSACGDLRNFNVEPLHNSKHEVEQIVQRWKASVDEPVVQILGAGASEDNFKKLAPGRRAVHLATHGFYLQDDGESETLNNSNKFREENPLFFSGLLLAGANLHGEVPPGIQCEDGILTAYEVSAMNLDGTDLVVLSACETGLGEVKEGEGVFGLRRAFEMAGARTVVCALWSVPDESTADMMGTLYTRNVSTIPDRIREMQLGKIKELRDAGLSDHPYSWAGFLAIGDWR